MHDYILLEIGQKLRKIRKGKGLTVQNIATRAGVSKGLISRIENGKTIPSLPVLIGVIKSLEFDLNSFFTDIDQKPLEQLVIKRADELTQKNRKETFISQLPIFEKLLKKAAIATSVLKEFH